MGNLGLHVDSIVSNYGKPARGSTLPKVVSCVLFADILINRLNLGSTDRHIFQLKVKHIKYKELTFLRLKRFIVVDIIKAAAAWLAPTEP